MPFYVYILYSSKLKRFYTGTTDNVTDRVERHNNGTYPDAYTLKGIPWEIFLIISCATSNQAYKLERFIKQMKSSAFIKKLKEQPIMVDDLLKRFE